MNDFVNTSTTADSYRAAKSLADSYHARLTERKRRGDHFLMIVMQAGRDNWTECLWCDNPESELCAGRFDRPAWWGR
jgi:hypothetical protein